MDHTVTYPWGAILTASPPTLPPCCRFHYPSSDNTINPTSRSHTWIQEYIEGFNRRPLSPLQLSARAELRWRLATTDFRSFFQSSGEVKALAKCLIDLTFGGRLFESCDFILASPNTMRYRGFTVCTCRCDTHQQIHAVKIVINPDDDPGAPEQADGRYLDRAGTVLHELCHAVLEIAVDRRSLTPMESIIYMGIDGHGTLFTGLFKAVAHFLGKHTSWIVDVDAACCRSVRRHRGTLAEALNIWGHIVMDPQESARTYAGLSQVLIREPGDDMRLLYLIREGRDVLELVFIMLFGGQQFDWRRPLQTVSRLDQAQRDPHLFIVEALSK